MQNISIILFYSSEAFPSPQQQPDRNLIFPATMLLPNILQIFELPLKILVIGSHQLSFGSEANEPKYVRYSSDYILYLHVFQPRFHSYAAPLSA